MIDLAPERPGFVHQRGYPPCPKCGAALYPLGAHQYGMLGCVPCSRAFVASERALRRARSLAKRDGIKPLVGVFADTEETVAMPSRTSERG